MARHNHPDRVGQGLQPRDSTIGNRLTVTGEGISPYAEDIESTMSRKGEPGIVVPAGTTATITKLRARHLR